MDGFGRTILVNRTQAPREVHLLAVPKDGELEEVYGCMRCVYDVLRKNPGAKGTGISGYGACEIKGMNCDHVLGIASNDKSVS